MTEYFTISSFHGTRICAQVTSGMVICAPGASPEPEAMPVIGFVLPHRPDLLFLVVNAQRVLPITLQFSSFRNMELPLHVTRSAASGQTTIHDPLHGRYLSAPPIGKPGTLAAVTASRAQAKEWEYFSLEALAPDQVAEPTAAVAAAMHELTAHGLGVDALIGFILASESRYAASALNGLLPLLGIAEISALSESFLNRPALLSRLIDHDPENFWATRGIGALAAWLKGRRAFVREGAAAVAGSTVRTTIGAEFDRLATEGRNGQFVSLSHACNAFARRAVTPRRGACMVMSARNEGIYLLEWIAHHRSIGFEWCYIYSNNNDDRSDELLSTLANAGIITWINSEISPGVPAQDKAYGHAFGMLPDILDFEWALVLDADEFLVPNPARFTSITDFLRWQSKREVDAIAMNWKFIGSNDEIGCLDELMTRRNTRLVDIALIGDGYRLIKTIFRPRLMLSSRSHTPVTDERSAYVYRLSTGDLHAYRNNPTGFHADAGFADNFNAENICIYHYFFKSAEEWLWKSSRNRGDHPMATGISIKSLNNDWIKNFMRQSDAPEQPFVNGMLAYRAKLDHELSTLLSLPQVASAAALVRSAYRTRLEDVKAAVRASPSMKELDETSLKFLRLAGIG